MIVVLKKLNINFITYTKFLFNYFPNFLEFFVECLKYNKKIKKINIEELLITKDIINLSDNKYYQLYTRLKLENFYSKTYIQNFKTKIDEEIFIFFKMNICKNSISIDIFILLKIFLEVFYKYSKLYNKKLNLYLKKEGWKLKFKFYFLLIIFFNFF
jgi:hypothetical protein